MLNMYQSLTNVMCGYYSNVVSRSSEFRTTNYQCLHLREWVTHLHIWVFIKTLLHELKKEKGKRKEKKDINHSNRLPRCSNFPHPLPSSAAYFWAWLCTTGLPAFKQYKTKRKSIDGRDIKYLCFFFLRFLVNKCIQNLKLSTLAPCKFSLTIFLRIKSTIWRPKSVPI